MLSVIAHYQSRVKKISLIFICLVAFAPHVFAQSLSADERIELERYRKTVPEMQQRLGEHAATQREILQAAKLYQVAIYDQRIKLTSLAVDAYRWQLVASNVILYLVVLLTGSGVCLGAYQLIVAARIAQQGTKPMAPPADAALPASSQPPPFLGSTSLEISKERASLQTSAVGLVVLMFSGLFLFLFLSKVYEVKPFTLPSIETEAGIQH